MIDFGNLNVSREDTDTILAIARKAKPKGSILSIVMDLEVCHAIACPLRLKDLLNAAGTYSFSHDLDGIDVYLNRETGKLGGGFLPRFAKRAR